MLSPNHVEIEVIRFPHGADLPLPGYETPGAAGMDLMAAVEEDLVIEPGKRLAVPTGLGIALPEGYEAQIRPRSGLALKQGLTVANAPGTIDSDYRGEVKAILINHGDAPVTITRGMRIAQMVIAPVTRGVFKEVQTLSETGRGAGGFGSTGV